MSRPSSYHGATLSADDDGFSLPLFQPAAPATSYQQQQQQQYPGLPPQSALHSQGDGRHQLHVSAGGARNSSTNPAPGSPYAAAPYANPVAPTGALPPSANGSSQRQTMHFPYAPAAPTVYPDELPSHSGHSSGSALGSLARSASFTAARRKDPISYPSDDVESGMAGGDSWNVGGNAPISSYPSQMRPTQQMPQPYINTSLRQNDMDVVMSPGRIGHTQQPPSSMPPPPLPHARVPQQQQASPAAAHLAQMPSAPQPPSNPYIPRGVDGAPPPQSADSWLSYRRSSHHSPHSGSVSPLPASPLSPAMAHGDLSPHHLTPQGVASYLPSSPRMHSANSATRDSSSPGYHVPAPSHRSHSQSFAASQPVTPSGRYDPGHPVRSGSRDGHSSRQGFRDIRDWTDLRPNVNSHPKGRRADPDVPGAYLSPLKCLTQTLPQTYSLCNPSFKYESSENPRRVLTKPSKPVYNDGADNEDWDYILYVNDVLGGAHGGDRYLILDVLGQGTFGQVVKCQNMRTHAICAVKVVKNKPAYLNQSKMEVAILNLLNREHDPRDEHHILRLLDSFTHKNHLCLVFECLSSNLYELIKQNQFKGLSLQLVKVFTQQLLDCLAVLKEARLIHCDLKPENILLKSLQSPTIKVIDFGSACHELQTVYTYIQSRFYRSPEVLLGLPYSSSIDMWSLGCIVVELFLGLPIFPGTSEYNQVSRIVDMLGLPPQHLLEVGKQTNEFFNCVGVDAQGRKQYKLKPMDQYATEHRTKEQPSKQYFKQTLLPDIISEYPFSKKNAKQSDIDREMSQRRAFINFVEGLLNLDPIKRWSPQQAAKHPFITGEKYTGPFEPPSVPTKRSTPAAVAPDASPSPASTSSSQMKKYGGLVQNPTPVRGQRVYSDAAAYNHQLAQHQYQTAQAAQAQAQTVRPGPFAADYQASPQQQYTKPRVSSQHGPPPVWPGHQPQHAPHQSMPPPQTNYHRIPSGTQQPPRPTIPVINAPTIPPPNSYFPASRNRANTINQMDTIPPALARLTNLDDSSLTYQCSHSSCIKALTVNRVGDMFLSVGFFAILWVFGAPDPQNRTALTPVLHREDMAEAWERRQAGGHKPSNLHNATYAQLEYLQEQAELVNMSAQQYVMPGQYAHQMPSHGGHHRGTQSFSGTQAYQMQPPIASHSTHASPHSARGPPVQLQPTSEYDPPGSAGSGSRAYLPAFPPAAATGTTTASPFDAFAGDRDMGLMYTPMQPTQNYGSYSPGHAARSSFSGPYSGASAQPRNPFAGPNSPRRFGGYAA